MELRNLSPFMPMSFESRDEYRNDFGVVAAKGTFDLVDGRRLAIAQEQDEFVLADKYFGDARSTSIEQANELAPFKPRTDVLVTANACSDGGVPRQHWNVGLSIGNKKKAFTVTGPRHWVKKMGATVATDIEPVSKVAIRYENAFGGTSQNGAKQVAFEANPVGTGFGQVKSDRVRIPQILPLGKIDINYGEQVEPVGLGPVAPHWQPRSQRVGTCDLIWRKTRFPDLPEDFNFEFYNSASTGMTLDGYANGIEKIQLQNLSEEGVLTFGLPGIDLASLMRYRSGEMVPGPMPLDTIHIDCLNRKVHLIWRGVFPTHIPLRVLEIRAKSRFQRSAAASTSPAMARG